MNIRRLYTGSGLDNDTLRSFAPSVFQVEAHPSRSETHYKVVPTIALVEGLRTEGWVPFSVQAATVRKESGRGFEKHMLRLRHRSQEVRSKGDEFNELVLVNSHDGSSSFQLMAGRFRLVCLNGMVVASRTVANYSIPHRGDAIGMVIEGATRIVEEFDRIEHSRNEMRSVMLKPDERAAFAQAALAHLYEDRATISPTQLLVPRRIEDNAPDLWSTLNVVQENLTHGGLRGITATGRRTSTRGVSGIGQDVALNKFLWEMAEFTRRLAVSSSSEVADAVLA